MREARQHPPKLRAKFKHYASRIRAIPPGGKMPADLVTNARALIAERMAQMAGEPTDQELRVSIITDHAPSQADMLAELCRKHAVPQPLLTQASRPGYGTNDKSSTMLVHTHHVGADAPIGVEEVDSHE